MSKRMTVEEALKHNAANPIAGNRALTAPTATVVLVASANPKRPNTASCRRFEFYGEKAGNRTTVAAFLKAGGTRRDLGWDYDHGYITLEAAEKPIAAEGEPKAA